MQLRRLPLSSGADQLITVSPDVHQVYMTPQLSPGNGDLVVQVGGGWGHLQTFSTRSTGDLFATDGNSDLHLIKAAVP